MAGLSKSCAVSLMLVGICLSMVLSGCSREGVDPSETTEAEEGQSIVLSLSCDGADDGSTPARILIGDSSDLISADQNQVFGLIEEQPGDAAPQQRPIDENDFTDHDVFANEEVRIPVDHAGKYSVYVDRSPVNRDGSTYSVPGSAIEVEVLEEVVSTEARITLERIPVENMSKEQLEDAAATLIAFDRRTEAKQVLKLASTAPTAAEMIAENPSTASRDLLLAARQRIDESETAKSIEEIVTDAEGHGDVAHSFELTPRTDIGNDSSSDRASERPNTIGIRQQCSHQWMNVIDKEARSEPKYIVEALCDQCKRSFSSVEGWISHLRRGSNCSTHTDSVKIVGTEYHAGKSHDECSICGARR